MVISFGSFFGKKDSWNLKNNNMKFFDKEEVYTLFEDFEIICFYEKDEDGTTAIGKKKHWHIYYVIAKKKI